MPATIEQARANLEASIPMIGERYKRGVMSANWVDAASSDQSESNYAAGVSRAVTLHSRQNGIRAAGNQKWQTAASTKGVAAIGEGIRRGLNAYAQNFGRVYATFLQVLPTLPARTSDPMTNIDARLKPTVTAWRTAAGKQ